MKKTAFTLELEKVNPHNLVRHTWGFRPTERVVESKKVYNRQKGKQEVRKAMHGEY